jgi:ribosomal protein S18 acetylase RimI-like enzyme
VSAEFAPPAIDYRETPDGIAPDQLVGFFVGWPNPPSPATHLRILRGSAVVVLALDAATGAVVGFVTAISDGVSCAYIPHLEVLPAYRGRGIGTELMRRILRRLRDLYMIDLLCDPDVRPFYARLGMRPADGMLIRNYERQAGRPSPDEG